MFHVILFQPEIPPNTGNIIRLCANSGSHLHLIEPLGFETDDKRLRRAGLDYHEFATLKRYPDLQRCLDSLGLTLGAPAQPDAPRLYAFTTKGSQPFHAVQYRPGDAFLFGPEVAGCPRRSAKPCRPNSACACPCARAAEASTCPTPWR